MKIKFLKDHLIHKAGTEVDNHPNSAYLITLGVAEEVKEKVEKVIQKEKVDMVKPPKKKQ